ncbi:MAG: hypothetical protein JXR52_02250 [Bacteroidales bacterium]|nr:hypothetical protein [Bacteroidales bacterium]MBN2697622.1 hypothetical protein [Bacteroidales bacterium]
MKKIASLLFLSLSLSGCAILSELTALTKCEFRFHSAQNPTLSGIDVTTKKAFSDFSFIEGQALVANILRGTLPFSITANVEVKNPGLATAAVNQIDWIAFIDDVRVSDGVINNRIEVAPNGGTTIVPIQIQTDLFEFLEGDNPRTMLNFGLNLMEAGGEPTRLSMQIKPYISIGGQNISYPGYFTINHEFSSGN